jgi:hypothetical protein
MSALRRMSSGRKKRAAEHAKETFSLTFYTADNFHFFCSLATEVTIKTEKYPLCDNDKMSEEDWGQQVFIQLSGFI